MSFTREELVRIGRAAFDYPGGVRDYLDNPAVAEIWNGLNVPEREDFASLCVLAKVLNESFTDAEFHDRLVRLPGAGQRLLFRFVEQQQLEDEIQSDDDLSHNQMRKKIATSRKRPLKLLSGLG